MKFRTSVILMGLLIAGLALSAPLKGGKWSLSASYKVTYDDNILRYSDRDLNRASDGTEVAVSPVTTLDDLRSDFKATIGYRFAAFDKLESRLTATGNFASFAVNPVNNLGWLSLTCRQQAAKDWHLSLNHFYEPYFFLRDFRDRHTGEYHHCDFAMAKTLGKIIYSPGKSMDLSCFGELKKYAYNQYFTEFDGDRIGFGGEGIYRHGPWRFSLLYSWGRFDNVGFDETDRIPAEFQDSEDNENGDGGYEEDGYELSCQYSFKLLGRKTAVKSQVSLDDRFYNTELPPESDAIHAGRHDRMLTTEASLDHAINKKVSLSLGSTLYLRESEAPNPLVSELKDYSRILVWVEIGYDFR